MKRPFGRLLGSGRKPLFPFVRLGWIRTEHYVREFEQAGSGGRRELARFPGAIAAWTFEGAIRIDPYLRGAHTPLHRQDFPALRSSALHAASVSACLTGRIAAPPDIQSEDANQDLFFTRRLEPWRSSLIRRGWMRVPEARLLEKFRANRRRGPCCVNANVRIIANSELGSIGFCRVVRR